MKRHRVMAHTLFLNPCSVIASLAYSYFKYREQQETQRQRAAVAETMTLPVPQGSLTNSSNNNSI